MPAGPPPPKSAPPLPQGLPPVPPAFPMGAPYAAPPFPPMIPPHAYMPPGMPLPPPGLPMGFQHSYAPPFAQNTVPYPQQMPGPGRGPRDRQHMEAARLMQDPLSNLPHVTFQAHQAQRHQLPSIPTASGSQPSTGLPPRPGSTSQAAASATVFAEPELRDLKKEATAFVPASMRRAAKKGPSNNTTSAGLQIDAAPSEVDDAPTSAEPRKDLMSVLGTQLGVGDKPAAQPKTQGGQGKDDYDKFLAEVGSFL
jgi:hypothetical protein